MKRFSSIIAFSFSLCMLYGQLPANLEMGSYKNLYDLLNNVPLYQFSFTVSKRTEFNIKMGGGNDYKVDSSFEQMQSAIYSKIFAVFDGENLYINGKHINGGQHYCLVENNQRYLILKAGIPGGLSRRKNLGYDDSMIQTDNIALGITTIGAAVRAAQLAVIRLYYIVDCKTGIIKILSKDYLISLLDDYPEIKEQFDLEKDNANLTVLLEYVKKINEKNNLITPIVEQSFVVPH